MRTVHEAVIMRLIDGLVSYDRLEFLGNEDHMASASISRLTGISSEPLVAFDINY